MVNDDQTNEAVNVEQKPEKRSRGFLIFLIVAAVVGIVSFFVIPHGRGSIVPATIGLVLVLSAIIYSIVRLIKKNTDKMFWVTSAIALLIGVALMAAGVYTGLVPTEIGSTPSTLGPEMEGL